MMTLPRDRRATVPATPVTDAALEGRARKLDGTAYAITSQAATDALNPFATGGICIAANEGQPLEIVGPGNTAALPSGIGYVVRAIAAGVVGVGQFVRPAYNADAALNDRLASVTTTALPTAAGTYWTLGIATTAAAAAGDEFDLVIFPVAHIVEEA
jgi:hypothetical protein